MSVLDICQFPHPVLKEEAQDVVEMNDAVERLIQDMAETMYHAPGVGLAANQVGVAKKIAVVDVSQKDEARNTMIIVNPRIIETGEETEVMEEACLSVPDLSSEVERAIRITVLGKDLKGEDVKLEAEGFLARVLQHEIDHLYGTLFIDRLGKLKRQKYIRQRKKAVQNDK